MKPLNFFALLGSVIIVVLLAVLGNEISISVVERLCGISLDSLAVDLDTQLFSPASNRLIECLAEHLAEQCAVVLACVVLAALARIALDDDVVSCIVFVHERFAFFGILDLGRHFAGAFFELLLGVVRVVYHCLVRILRSLGGACGAY